MERRCFEQRLLSPLFISNTQYKRVDMLDTGKWSSFSLAILGILKDLYRRATDRDILLLLFLFLSHSFAVVCGYGVGERLDCDRERSCVQKRCWRDGFERTARGQAPDPWLS